jgi:hypothetical protein
MSATRAFSYNVFPGVSVTDMQKYGYTPPTGNQILLGKAFVVELETALATLGKGRLMSRMQVRHSYAPTILEGNLLLLLEATVLHEMVHFWRRIFDDSARLNIASSRGRAIEEAVAQKFEKDAYGCFLTPNKLLLTKYMPITSTWNK